MASPDDHETQDDHGTLEILSASVMLDFSVLAAPAAVDAAAPAPAGPAGSPPGSLVALSLADLLPDAHGDVVIFDESGLTEMAVLAGGPPVDRGIAESHVTAGGIDVAGMAFYSFESGVTLYLPPEIHLSVLSA